MIQKVINSFPEANGLKISDGLPDECLVAIDGLNRYAEANIPVDYWFLDMEEFKGDSNIKKHYDNITSDFRKSYVDGIRYCFAGKHGRGKTMVCACVLKKAVEKGYSGLYTTLSDIVALMASHDADGKYTARQDLLQVDFLVIDEFDPRFMGSTNSADLFGRILESIIRGRLQNRMPTMLCTNSKDATSAFSGPLKESIGSLMYMFKIVPVLGKDFRKVD